MSTIIELKTHPEVMRVIRAADPSYKKHKAILVETASVTLNGTFWDGGTRYSYTAVKLDTCRSQGAPQYDPPLFGGPRTSPQVPLPEGVVIVSTGTFCGKTATATVYVNPANMTKLLPAPAVTAAE